MLVLDTQGQEQRRRASAKDEAAALRQQSLQQDILSNSVTVEPDEGRDVSNLLAQMGRPLSSQEMQRRLKIINPRLIFERNLKYPELTGIYIEVSEKNATGGFSKRKMHLFGMESGMMPEFSVIHKAKKQVANPELFGKTTPTREVGWLNVDTYDSETRGWRTVLLRLLNAKLITKLDVERHFGWNPSHESEKWNRFTKGA